MIVSCYFSSIVVKYIGIRGALCVGLYVAFLFVLGVYVNEVC